MGNPLVDRVTLGTMVVMAKSVPPEVAALTDVVESLLKPCLLDSKGGWHMLSSLTSLVVEHLLPEPGDWSPTEKPWQLC